MVNHLPVAVLMAPLLTGCVRTQETAPLPPGSELSATAIKSRPKASKSPSGNEVSGEAQTGDVRSEWQLVNVISRGDAANRYLVYVNRMTGKVRYVRAP